MAWFLNYYECDRCGFAWKDKWSATCNDECPACGAPDMQPHESDDLTEIIKEDTVNGGFVVLRSPDSAEHRPDYKVLIEFATREEAKQFLKARLESDDC